MIRHAVTCFVALAIICSSLFAAGDVRQHDSHHNTFQSPHTHEHRHVHQNAEHKHGHVHKAGFVDYFIARIDGLDVVVYGRENNFILKQWHPEPVPSELFRPPIA